MGFQVGVEFWVHKLKVECWGDRVHFEINRAHLVGTIEFTGRHPIQPRFEERVK